jgi:hypothetical protein
MRDDALVKLLRDQLKTYIEARDRDELIAKTYPDTEIGRECAGRRKALDGAIESVNQALKIDGPDA